MILSFSALEQQVCKTSTLKYSLSLHTSSFKFRFLIEQQSRPWCSCLILDILEKCIENQLSGPNVFAYFGAFQEISIYNLLGFNIIVKLSWYDWWLRPGIFYLLRSKKVLEQTILSSTEKLRSGTIRKVSKQIST